MRRARIREIALLASRMTGIAVGDIVGPRRNKHFCRVRFAVALVASEHQHSTTNIGRILNGRDHSSITHARKAALELAERDADYAQFIIFLREEAASLDEPIDMDFERARQAPCAPARLPRAKRHFPVVSFVPPKARNVFAPIPGTGEAKTKSGIRGGSRNLLQAINLARFG